MNDLRFILTYNSISTTLSSSPDGWDTLKGLLERSTDKRGALNNTVVSLQFVKEGAEIIRDAYYSKGISATVTVEVQKRDWKTNTYSTKYTGEIDMAEITDNENGVSCQLIPTGLMRIWKENGTTEYELPTDTNRILKYDGVILTGDYVTFNKNIRSETVSSYPGTYEVTVPFDLSTFGDLTNGAMIPVTVDITDDAMITAVRRLKLTVNDLELNIATQDANSSNNATITHQIILRITGLADVVLTTWTVNVLGGGVIVNSSGTVDISLERILNAGDEFKLIFKTTSTQTTGNYLYYSFTDSIFDSVFDSTLGTTNIECLTVKDVFQELVSRVTDGQYTAVSDWIDANYGRAINDEPATMLLFASGNGIRGLSGDTIKLSLEKFFKILNKLRCVGMDNRDDNGDPCIRIEGIDYFFNTDSTITITDIEQISIRKHDGFFNLIKTGYPAQDYDEVNGKDEFQGTLIFESPVKKIISDYDIVCNEARADMYGWEFTRLSGASADPTQDKPEDNEVFIILAQCTTGTATNEEYIPYRPVNQETDTTGLLNVENAFNLLISPKQNLVNHLPYIASYLYGVTSGGLVYISMDRNKQLAYDGLIEIAGISVEDLPTAIFKPYVITCNCVITADQLDQILESPYKKITISPEQGTFSGWILSLSYKIVGTVEAQINLLVDMDTDLTTLIR